MSKRKNPGEGYGYNFSGAFKKKSDAVKKEKSRKGSFIKPTMTGQGYRYLVMTPRENPASKRSNPTAEGHSPAARKVWRKAHKAGLKATKLSLAAQQAYGGRGFEKKRQKALVAIAEHGRLIQEFHRIEAETNQRLNPAELVVLGANPLEHLRTNPVNPGSGYSSMIAKAAGHKRRSAGLISTVFGTRGVYQRKHRRKMEKQFRSGGGSSHAAGNVKSDVISALRNLGYSASAAKASASRASGSDFDSLFRSAQEHLRKNPMVRKWHGKLVKNPSAAAIREDFVGSPADRAWIANEPHMAEGDYAQLGELLALHVKPMHGGQVVGIDFKSRRPTVVADESARQIYFVGGEQDVTLSLESVFHATPMPDAPWIYELGDCKRIDYKQRKEHAPDPEFDEWKHYFGEESNVKPRLLFDARAKRLLLSGGEYEIRSEGIIN